MKLVRDRIPEIMIKNGQSPRTKVVSDVTEVTRYLHEKLLEEVNEFIESTNDTSAQEELADILEVINAICVFKSYDQSSIRQYQGKKRAERGGFDARIVLMDSENPDR